MWCLGSSRILLLSFGQNLCSPHCGVNRGRLEGIHNANYLRIPLLDGTKPHQCFDRGTHVHRCKLIQWKHLCAVDGNHAQLPCGILWQQGFWIDRWPLQPAVDFFSRICSNFNAAKDDKPRDLGVPVRTTEFSQKFTMTRAAGQLLRGGQFSDVYTWAEMATGMTANSIS